MQKKDLDRAEKCPWVIISQLVSCCSMFLKRLVHTLHKTMPLTPVFALICASFTDYLCVYLSSDIESQFVTDHNIYTITAQHVFPLILVVDNMHVLSALLFRLFNWAHFMFCKSSDCDSNLKQIYCCKELLFLYRDHHAPDMCDVVFAVSCLLPVNKCLTQESSKHHHPLLPAGLQPARPSRSCREPWSTWITRVHGSYGSPWEGWPRRERWSEGRKGTGRYLLTD